MPFCFNHSFISWDQIKDECPIRWAAVTDLSVSIYSSCRVTLNYSTSTVSSRLKARNERLYRHVDEKSSCWNWNKRENTRRESVHPSSPPSQATVYSMSQQEDVTKLTNVQRGRRKLVVYQSRRHSPRRAVDWDGHVHHTFALGR